MKTPMPWRESSFLDTEHKDLSIPYLPDKYTTVHPATAPPKEQFVPKSDGSIRPNITHEVETFQDEYEWLKEIKTCADKDFQEHQIRPWASYHASI